MGYGYRLMSYDGFATPTSTNPKGTQLALAEMDPDPLNVAAGHRNVWVEATLDARREWVEFFGPAHQITRADSWNVRSNDANRISTFPPETPPVSSPGGGDGDGAIGAKLAEIIAILIEVLENTADPHRHDHDDA
jgi:hypothetical protein